MYYIGMISGTSRDGADAALVSFTGDQPTVHEAVCVPYPAALAGGLQSLVISGRRPNDEERARLDQQLADHFSHTADTLIKRAAISRQDVRAIGSHGQTVWHHPEGPDPESIQLGDPQRIARRTRIVTVGDFRRADIVAGGQGAPLAPLLHRALFSPGKESTSRCRIVLNLGGIANISIIDGSGNVTGYDTGPANCLLDAWIQHHRNVAYDANGAWAEGGTVSPGLLQNLLADPYFSKPAPKSTGIEYFNLSWLEHSGMPASLDARDVQSTLAELTAMSVVNSIRPHQPGDVLVCGGGIHNSDLMARLRDRLEDIPLRSTLEFGLDPDWVEATLFAWLARERLAGRPLDTPAITGARQPVLLGAVSNPADPLG